MMQTDQKDHWENVYATKSPNEVSWTQAIPKTSIELIESCGNDKSASIIDIGGGDSNLVDHLLDLGYENISVLDISAKAIESFKVPKLLILLELVTGIIIPAFVTNLQNGSLLM